ncbi:MAG: Ig domain-containing protein [Chloroflexota bacterium]
MRDPSILLRQLALHARAAVLSFAAVLAVAIGVPMLAHADPTALTVTTTTLPAAEVNAAYSQTFVATGGTAPYTWSLVTGTLPVGVALNATTGALSGTPTATGTSAITVRATDSSSNTATAALSLVVNAAVSVSTTTLPASQVGVAYSQTLAAINGVAPYNWSIISGALPAGLALNATTGVISGTATAVGAGTFSVRVTDSYSKTADQALSIVVGQAVQTTTTTLAAGMVGVAYSQTLVGSGGVTPYTWSITTGTLPAGLTLTGTTGVIAGTPTTAGTSSFAVQVTDANGQLAAGALSINITSVSSLVITSASLPAGTVGSAYAQTLAASGGVAPYTWSVVGGGLPAGLTLGTAGVLSGTPTAAGTSTFTVSVADSASHTASVSLSLLVNTTTIPVGNLDADVLAACARGSLTASIARLCEVYTGGQLPPWAAVVVGRIIVKYTDEQPVTFNDKVTLACQQSGISSSIASLCAVYVAGDLPAWAKTNIGGVILGVTGNAQVSFKDDDKNKGKSHFVVDCDNVPQAKFKADAKPTVIVIPAPTVVVQVNTNANRDDSGNVSFQNKDDHRDDKKDNDKNKSNSSWSAKVTTTVVNTFKKH